jgi:hypothetical protein
MISKLKQKISEVIQKQNKASKIYLDKNESKLDKKIKKQNLKKELQKYLSSLKIL